MLGTAFTRDKYIYRITRLAWNSDGGFYLANPPCIKGEAGKKFTMVQYLPHIRHPSSTKSSNKAKLSNPSLIMVFLQLIVYNSEIRAMEAVEFGVFYFLIKNKKICANCCRSWRCSVPSRAAW